MMAQRTVTGSVADEQGEPLIGASVLVKGTNTGTTTDIAGAYSVTVPEGSNTLVVSYTGFQTQEIELGASNAYDVVLVEGSQLSEVVVTGYGTQTRRKLTSNIASTGEESFENVSVQNFEAALQGRMPGVVISNNAGTLGSQAQIRVRGVGSINASNQPLFVVDGMILNDDYDAGAALGGPGTNPLIGINPNDIESVEVLKDAAAQAIYGSRGANGVVIITTKSGSYNARPRTNINYYAGWNEPTEQFDLLTGPEYAQYWNQQGEGFVRSVLGEDPQNWYDPDYQENVIAPIFGAPQLYENPEEEPNTDWLDAVSQRGFVQEMSASVSGGSRSTKYYMGATYRDEDGWIKTTNLKRYSFRANIEQMISDKFMAGIQINPSRTENTRQNEDNNVASPQTYSVLAFPNVEPRDENGNIIALPQTSIGSSVFPGQPVGNLEGQDISLVVNQVIATGYLEYRPFSFLKFRTELGGQYTNYEDNIKQASFTTDGFGVGGAADALSRTLTSFNWTAFGTYNQLFGRSELDATLGVTLTRDRTNAFSVFGQTFADDRLKTLNSAAEIIGGGGFGTDVTFEGYFLRANYFFDSKYLLSASLRVDGSSRFGADNRYGIFPAVSAGWVLSEEPWMEGNFFDFLKLRASWGISGNAAIGNFDARGLIAFGNDYNMIPGYQFSQLENNELEWEKSETIDFGLDFEFLDNRVRGSLAYYTRYTRDLLLNTPLPFTIGFTTPSIAQNIGEIRNQGFEFTLDVDVIKTQNVLWTIGVNGATLDNEVTRLVDNNNDGEPDDIVEGQSLVRVGETIGSWYLVDYLGVDPETGTALFASPNEETGEIDTLSNQTPSGARQVFGSPIPQFSGGFNTRLEVANFDISALFVFATGFQLYRSEGRFYERNGGSFWNQTRNQLNAWTPDNPNTDVPEARLFTNNGNQHSTRYLSDADFLRLRNLQIGYTFKNIGKNRNSIRIFASGQNLLLWTKFDGLDPEASGQTATGFRQGDLFFSRPQTRSYTFGVNLFL